MIVLEAGQTLRGIASPSPNAITYTIEGMEFASNIESYKALAQGQLGNTVGTIYTVPASTQAFIKSIHLASTSGVDLGVKLFVGGAAAGNQLTGSMTIPANGWATYEEGGWKIYNSLGVLFGTTPPSKIGLFLVDRNGVDQTGLTARNDNKITWTNAPINNEGWFSLATGKYTPQVAGSYVFTISLNTTTGASGGESNQPSIWKNGAKVKNGTYSAASGSNVGVVTAVIAMNGTTDYVEAYAYMPNLITALAGTPLNTFFQGYRQDV